MRFATSLTITQQSTTKVKDVITSLPTRDQPNSITTVEDMKSQITTATVEQTLVAGEINQVLRTSITRLP
ncbi:hypothetical protein O9993_17470 [Vibrio lentus]|nr:hypothetical protein [Vibrio lentus]